MSICSYLERHMHKTNYMTMLCFALFVYTAFVRDDSLLRSKPRSQFDLSLAYDPQASLSFCLSGYCSTHSPGPYPPPGLCRTLWISSGQRSSVPNTTPRYCPTGHSESQAGFLTLLYHCHITSATSSSIFPWLELPNSNLAFPNSNLALSSVQPLVTYD